MHHELHPGIARIFFAVARDCVIEHRLLLACCCATACPLALSCAPYGMLICVSRLIIALGDAVKKQGLCSCKACDLDFGRECRSG